MYICQLKDEFGENLFSKPRVPTSVLTAIEREGTRNGSKWGNGKITGYTVKNVSKCCGCMKTKL